MLARLGWEGGRDSERKGGQRGEQWAGRDVGGWQGMDWLGMGLLWAVCRDCETGREGGLLAMGCQPVASSQYPYPPRSHPPTHLALYP